MPAFKLLAPCFLLIAALMNRYLQYCQAMHFEILTKDGLFAIDPFQKPVMWKFGGIHNNNVPTTWNRTPAIAKVALHSFKTRPQFKISNRLRGKITQRCKTSLPYYGWGVSCYNLFCSSSKSIHESRMICNRDRSQCALLKIKTRGPNI